MSQTGKTTKKRPPSNGKTFSKEYQPSGEAKSAGHRKKRMLKELLEATFIGPKRSKVKMKAAEYLGVDPESLTVEDLLHFKQIEIAISKGNTFAYQAVMDRAYGKPTQPTDERKVEKIIVTIKDDAA